MVFARVAAVVLFIFAVLAAFGWGVEQDAARAVGLIAAGLLAFVLSTIPVGRIP